MPKRVLHIIPDLTMGGAEVLVVNLLTVLDRTRWIPEVVSLFGPHDNILEARLRDAGITVHSLGKRLGFDPRMWPRMERCIRDFTPHIIHTHRYALGYAVPLLLAHRRTRSVHTFHTLAQHEVGQRGKLLHRTAFRAGTVPISISNQIATSVREVHGIETSPVVLNGIDVDHFARPTVSRDAWRAQSGCTADDVLFVCVARLSAVKNHALLIDAFCRLPHTGARLLLIGEGDQRSAIEARIRELGCTDRVQLLGQVDDVCDILHAADVLVLSSVFEGIPLTIQEAMAAGRPVVATQVGGISELIDDGVNGHLVPSGDVDALAAALTTLSENKDAREHMGIAARDTAVSRFRIQSTARAYERIYQAILDGDDPVRAAAGGPDETSAHR